MKEPLLANLIFDLQYAEINHLMTIVHVLNTKQNVIHFWIIREVYKLAFYFIPHLEEHIPQIYIGTVEKKCLISFVSSQYGQQGNVFIVITNICLFQFVILWNKLYWNDCRFVSRTTWNAPVKIPAHFSSRLEMMDLIPLVNTRGHNMFFAANN